VSITYSCELWYSCFECDSQTVEKVWMTRLELYTAVALRHDVPEYELKQGDVVTLIDYVKHPGGGKDGYILEIFNAIGESIAVIAIPVSAVEPLRANEILSVRQLTRES